MKKILLLLSWGLMAPLLLSAQDNKLETVVIDAGHGGKDPGCLGKNHQEKDVALNIALQLGNAIKTFMPEVEVIYTRKRDVFVELHERARIANKAKADLFISVHCNAAPSHQVSGTETFCMGLSSSEANMRVAKRENSVILEEENHKQHYGGFDPDSPMGNILFANMQNAHLESSLKFAEKIEQRFQSYAERSSRGVKQAGFLVLWQTAMPSVLIETGYLTNRSEEQYLAHEIHQAYIAYSIYRAFRDYKMEVEGKSW